MTLDLSYPVFVWRLVGRGYASDLRELTEGNAVWWLYRQRASLPTLGLELERVGEVGACTCELYGHCAVCRG